MPIRRGIAVSFARFGWSVSAMACAACAAPPAEPLAPGGRLEGTDGAMHVLLPSSASRFTVLVFFVAGCRHLEVHDTRLRQLAQEYGRRGVAFYAVDSDMHGSMDVDRAEVARHGYPFPILRDVGGRLARRVGAQHAGYAVVVGADGRARYRGAIDSDRFRLREDAVPYLAAALEDLLAGREPRIKESASFGCALDP